MSSQRSWQILDLRGYRCSGCLLIFVLLCLPAWATTYYVDNCVTVGSDSNNGTSPATAWLTIAHVKAQSFNPGDSVLFQRTCTWREEFDVPASSGSAGSVITYGSYGTGAAPQILGSVSASTAGAWTAAGPTNVWKTTGTISTTPNIVWRDNVPLTLVAGTGSLANTSQYYYAAGVVYVHASGNPTTGSHVFEIPQRNVSIYVANSSYLSFSNLTLAYGNLDGFIFENSNNILVNGINSSYAYDRGVGNAGDSTDNTNFITIQNGTFNWNGAGGIRFSGGGGSGLYGLLHDLTFQNNSVVSNGWQTSYTIYTGGIYIWGNYANVDGGSGASYNATIQNNYVCSTQFDQASGLGEAAGIWVDEWGTGAVVRHNEACNNAGPGIIFEHHSGTVGYANVLYGNATNFPFLPYQFVFYRGTSNMLGYNNTCYGGANCFGVVGTASFPVMVSNTLENNIAAGYSGQGLAAFYGGENAGSGSGNTYLYNAFGAAANNFIQWGNGTYKSTYSTWENATGTCGYTGCSHSIQTTPTFTNAAGNNFTLASGSSAIAAGTNLGATYQFGLDPRTSFPWGTLNQNRQGSGWEIGAFVFVQQIPPAPPTSLSATVK